jgi:hypothetical protein
LHPSCTQVLDGKEKVKISRELAICTHRRRFYAC